MRIDAEFVAGRLQRHKRHFSQDLRATGRSSVGEGRNTWPWISSA